MLATFAPTQGKASFQPSTKAVAKPKQDTELRDKLNRIPLNRRQELDAMLYVLEVQEAPQPPIEQQAKNKVKADLYERKAQEIFEFISEGLSGEYVDLLGFMVDLFCCPSDIDSVNFEGSYTWEYRRAKELLNNARKAVKAKRETKR